MTIRAVVLAGCDGIVPAMLERPLKRHEARTSASPPNAAYDSASESYELNIVPKFRPVAEALLEAARLQPEDRVLEIAAGTGGLARIAAEEQGRGLLIVTDLSRPMLLVGRRILAQTPSNRVRLAEADMRHLPFVSASCDVVIAQFSPLQDHPVALKEVWRVLRDDGRLALAMWGSSYDEVRVIRAAREAAGLPRLPVASAGRAARRLAAAGFVDVVRQDLRLVLEQAGIEEYIAYRRSFGVPPEWSRLTERRYFAALRSQLRTMFSKSGPVHLSWRCAILTATKPRP